MLKVSRWIYLSAAGLFLLGVVTQVFLAGMVVVASRMSWNNHISLGHILAGPLLLMLISMYPGRLPVKRLTWSLFAVYILQADVVIFLRHQAPIVSALHPVLALVDFTLGLALARRAWAVMRQAQVPVAAQPNLVTPAMDQR